jgi:hypothetical protein
VAAEIAAVMMIMGGIEKRPHAKAQREENKKSLRLELL